MSITKLSSTEYYQIETLWLELNLLHGELSSEFKEHFATATFEKRIESLLDKDSLVIFAASNDEDLIGYCIASINNEKGEIDSLYVKPSYRGKNQGKKLVQKSLNWLQEKQCANIDIQVAQGNEEVLSFYEQFGFKKRFHVLQIRNT